MPNLKLRRFSATLVAVLSVTTVPVLVDLSVKEWSFGVTTLLSILVAVVLAFVIHFLWPSVNQRLERRKQVVESTYDGTVEVLVATFGLGNANPRDGEPPLLDTSLKFFSPQSVILLATEESIQEAKGAMDKWKNQSGRMGSVEKIDGSTIGTGSLREKLQEIIHVDPSQVVVDVTGGTKSMAISAYLVAGELEYVAAYRVPRDPKVKMEAKVKFEIFRPITSTDRV